MKKVASLAAYKAKKGIVPPNSPYYTGNATDEQIQSAVEHAIDYFDQNYDNSGMPPYAVVIGYEDKRGHVKLLKDVEIYSTKDAFEGMVGMATMKTVAVVKDNGL